MKTLLQTRILSEHLTSLLFTHGLTHVLTLHNEGKMLGQTRLVTWSKPNIVRENCSSGLPQVLLLLCCKALQRRESIWQRRQWRRRSGEVRHGLTGRARSLLSSRICLSISCRNKVRRASMKLTLTNSNRFWEENSLQKSRNFIVV